MEHNNGGLEDDVPLQMGEFLAKPCWLSVVWSDINQKINLGTGIWNPNFFWWQWFIRCLSETESSGKKNETTKRHSRSIVQKSCIVI